MDTLQKIDLLGEAARYDLCRGCGTHENRVRDALGRWIFPAIRPDGKRIAMLKVLQTNFCEKDCAYCANRHQRDSRRISFSPEELARTFDTLLRRGQVQGLFLSSGVCGNVGRATERMLATVELIRRHGFRGYIHLKILPGADEASIEASVRLANRVSVNLEAPNAQRIRALSHTKNFDQDLLAPLRQANRLRYAAGRQVSLTTQFVVGAADETDREILTTAAQLYRDLRLARAYYSGFQPIANTPLENHAATPPWREHRLYQADFLLRQYGYALEEIIFDAQGHLPRETDPKLMWALCHPEYFPIEINSAGPELLLRVPGIGPLSAKRIIAQRRKGTLCDLQHIALTGADAHRAAPFILLNGRPPTYQPMLFDWLPA